jgi:hypothetical protein
MGKRISEAERDIHGDIAQIEVEAGYPHSHRSSTQEIFDAQYKK